MSELRDMADAIRVRTLADRFCMFDRALTLAQRHSGSTWWCLRDPLFWYGQLWQGWAR